jgi:seryl-tRNA synthetase
MRFKKLAIATGAYVGLLFIQTGIATYEDLATERHATRLADTNHDGKIDAPEALAAYRQLRYGPQDIMDTITYDEKERYVLNHLQQLDASDKRIQKPLSNMLAQHGEEFSVRYRSVESIADALADTNRSGDISREEAENMFVLCKAPQDKLELNRHDPPYWMLKCWALQGRSVAKSVRQDYDKYIQIVDAKAKSDRTSSKGTRRLWRSSPL